MSELVVLIRIALHVLSGYLLAAGVPPDLVQVITTNPAVVDALVQAIALIPSIISLVWWRIAKWRGWAT